MHPGGQHGQGEDRLAKVERRCQPYLLVRGRHVHRRRSDVPADHERAAKIGHIVQVSNEVIDDSDPPVVQVLTDHLTTTLGLKLDAAIYTGGTALPGITRMSYLSNTQSGGTAAWRAQRLATTGSSSRSDCLGARMHLSHTHSRATRPSAPRSSGCRTPPDRRPSRRPGCRRSTPRRQFPWALHFSTARVSSRSCDGRTVTESPLAAQ
jgi:Phage capsid family